ncbi:MAG TPA: PEP-CTERM sorting domain-containing protein [Isosphaeraceae bacterium]
MMQPKSETSAARLPLSTVARAVFLVALLLGVDSPALAGFTAFFGIDEGAGTPPTPLVNSLTAHNSFVGALTGVGVENFDSRALNAFPTTLALGPTSITATATTNDAAHNFVNNGTPNGAFATSGTQFLYQDGTNPAGNDNTLTFSAAVAGVGMYVTDLNDGTNPADQLRLVVTLADASTQTFTTANFPNDHNANVFFFGVVSSDPALKIASVRILNTVPNGGDAFGIDDLTVGTAAAVPEPASLALLGAGTLGVAVGCVRRRRRPSRFAQRRTDGGLEAETHVRT